MANEMFRIGFRAGFTLNWFGGKKITHTALSNTISTNSVNLRQGYLFIQPIEDERSATCLETIIILLFLGKITHFNFKDTNCI